MYGTYIEAKAMLFFCTSPTALHKSLAEKSPLQGKESDSEIKTYFAHLAQH